MLDDIRFTIPAVAKKAWVEELTHFRIRDGRITGFDGRMALSSTIGVDLDVRPAAAKFLAAVRACQGGIALHVTGAGKLALRDEAGFRAYVECLPDDDGPAMEPEGEDVALGEAFMTGLRTLSPAMGIDASRPWAMGIKVAGPSMYATNNVIFAQFWHGDAFPHDVVIPSRAVEEVLRVGKAPTRVQVCPHSVTFWWGEERWLKTNLLDGGQWPTERLGSLLDSLATGEILAPLPAGFGEALATLKPFLAEDHGVYLLPGEVRTSREEGGGAAVALPGLTDVPDLSLWSYQQLEILGRLATAVNWRAYPKPCIFQRNGAPLRGLILGRNLP